MNELATIGEATTIARNVADMTSKLSAHMSTGEIRKARNKLAYSVKTISDVRRFADAAKLAESDHARIEAMLDAFTLRACDDILNRPGAL